MAVATGIIVIGCGGEYIFGDRATVAAAKLQNASDLKISSLTLAAKTAEGKIAEAQQSAATAIEAAGKLGATLDNLNNFVNRKTTETNAAIDSLATATQAARAGLVSLQERQTQRSLKPNERTALLQVLSEFRGQKASVSCLNSDNETCIFGKDFVSLLVESGWDLGEKPQVRSAIFSGGDVGTEGIQVSIALSARENPPAAMWPLINELLGLGLITSRSAFVNAATPNGEIEVRIGPRAPLPAR
jgi:hypothetical protein